MSSSRLVYSNFTVQRPFLLPSSTSQRQECYTTVHRYFIKQSLQQPAGQCAFVDLLSEDTLTELDIIIEEASLRSNEVTSEVTLPTDFDMRAFCKSLMYDPQHTAHHATVNTLLTELSEQRIDFYTISLPANGLSAHASWTQRPTPSSATKHMRTRRCTADPSQPITRVDVLLCSTRVRTPSRNNSATWCSLCATAFEEWPRHGWRMK